MGLTVHALAWPNPSFVGRDIMRQLDLELDYLKIRSRLGTSWARFSATYSHKSQTLITIVLNSFLQRAILMEEV